VTLQDAWRELEGRRVTTRYMACITCGGREGVLRRHHCKDELEIFCDYCEEWTGARVTKAQVQGWLEVAPDFDLSRSCPV
jgi:hypothetical protein